MAKTDKGDTQTKQAASARTRAKTDEAPADRHHRRLNDAHWRYSLAVNQATIRSQQGVANAQGDFARAQNAAQAAFQDDGDVDKLRAALDDASQAYWAAVSAVQEETTKSLSAVRADHWNTIKGVIADLDADVVDRATLGHLTQSLGFLAC